MANEKLGKQLLVKIWDATTGAYKTVARATSYNMEVNKETIEVTSLDSAGWKEFLVDLKEWNVSGDGLVTRTTEAGFENYEDLLTSLIGTDTSLVLQLIDPDTYTDSDESSVAQCKTFNHEVGKAFLTSLPISGSVGDKQTYSFSFQGTEDLTHVVAKYETATQAGLDSASYAENDVIIVLDQLADDSPGPENRGYYQRNTTVSTVFASAWDAYTV